MPTLLIHTHLQAAQVIAQPKLTKKYASPTPNDRQKSTGYNSGFALWGLTCFVETLVQGSTFELRMNISAKNPHNAKPRTVSGHCNEPPPKTISFPCCTLIYNLKVTIHLHD